MGDFTLFPLVVLAARGGRHKAFVSDLGCGFEDPLRLVCRGVESSIGWWFRHGVSMKCLL